MINYTEYFTEELVKQLEESNPEVGDELDLRYQAPPLTANEIRVLAAAIEHGKIVRHLELNENNIGDEGAALLAQTTCLKYLDVTENGIGNEGAKALANNISITLLDLSWNQVGDEGAIALAQNKSIKNLLMSQNPIGLKGIEAIANMTNLRKLSLLDHELGIEEAKLLAHSKSLTTLALSDNQLGDEGAGILAESKSLARLSIDRNKIGDSGAQALARNRYFYSLSLSSNRITPKGAEAFLLNTTLLYIEVNNNLLNPDIEAQLDEKIKQNQAQIEPERKQLLQAIVLLVLSRKKDNPAPICQLPADLLIYLSSYISFPCSKHGWYKRTGEEVARFIVEHSADYQGRLQLSLQADKANALRLREEIPSEPGLPSSYRFTFFYRTETLPEEPDSAMPPAKLPRLEL